MGATEDAGTAEVSLQSLICYCSVSRDQSYLGAQSRLFKTSLLA